MAHLNTPEKINAWMVWNISYDFELLQHNSTRQWRTFHEFWRLGIKNPIETFYDRRGVCTDGANLAGYALNKAGYTVRIVTTNRTAFAKGRDTHTVCAFKRGGKWWVCGDLRWQGVGDQIAGPFDTLKHVARYAVGGSLYDYSLDRRRKGF